MKNTKYGLLLSVDYIEFTDGRYYMELNNDSLRTSGNTTNMFYTENGKQIPASKIKPGQKIYIKLFSDLPIKNNPFKLKLLKKLFLTRRIFYQKQLPNFILNN